MSFYDRRTAETDKDGAYNLSVIPGWIGKITPIKEGYKFTPPSMHYETEVFSNISANDYIAESDTVISGTVTIEGKGVADVILKFKGAKEGDDYVTVTDAKGNYQQEVPYNWSGSVILKNLRDAINCDAEKSYARVVSSLDKQNFNIADAREEKPKDNQKFNAIAREEKLKDKADEEKKFRGSDIEDS